MAQYKKQIWYCYFWRQTSQPAALYLDAKDMVLIFQSLLEERDSLTTSLDMSVGKIQDLERKQREHEGIIR
jgi:hypothetical protein